MVRYVDYTFYTGTYGGSAVASSEFLPLAIKASAMMDMLSSNRIAAIITLDDDDATIEKIKLATCAVIDEMYKVDSAGGILSSESVGSHSVSYALPKNTSFSQRFVGVAAPFLVGTGLLFRGFYADEYGDDTLSEIADL